MGEDLLLLLGRCLISTEMGSWDLLMPQRLLLAWVGGRSELPRECTRSVQDPEPYISASDMNPHALPGCPSLPRLCRETAQDRLVASSYEESADMARRRQAEEAAQRQHLAVPRRPAWHSGMSAHELDAQERTTFLEWRRKLAK